MKSFIFCTIGCRHIGHSWRRVEQVSHAQTCPQFSRMILGCKTNKQSVNTAQTNAQNVDSLSHSGKPRTRLQHWQAVLQQEVAQVEQKVHQAVPPMWEHLEWQEPPPPPKFRPVQVQMDQLQGPLALPAIQDPHYVPIIFVVYDLFLYQSESFFTSFNCSSFGCCLPLLICIVSHTSQNILSKTNLVDTNLKVKHNEGATDLGMKDTLTCLRSSSVIAIRLDIVTLCLEKKGRCCAAPAVSTTSCTAGSHSYSYPKAHNPQRNQLRHKICITSIKWIIQYKKRNYTMNV